MAAVRLETRLERLQRNTSLNLDLSPNDVFQATSATSTKVEELRRRGLAAVDLVIEAALRGADNQIEEIIRVKVDGRDVSIGFEWGGLTDITENAVNGTGWAKVIGNHGIEAVDDVMDVLANIRNIPKKGRTWRPNDASLELTWQNKIVVLRLERVETADGVREMYVFNGYREGPRNLFDISQITGAITFGE